MLELLDSHVSTHTTNLCNFSRQQPTVKIVAIEFSLYSAIENGFCFFLVSNILSYRRETFTNIIH